MSRGWGPLLLLLLLCWHPSHPSWMGEVGGVPPPLPPPPPEQHTYPMSLLNAFPLAPAPLLNPVPDTPSSL